ncbi:TIGR02206 family membrane protein [Gammaproteobacteria bacterium]|nr:TIGR02206 family membrane protein [Gammaproteobacteria bacterium]
MNDLPFQIFGTQHLISLTLCIIVILGFPYFYKNQSDDGKLIGARIAAGLIIFHLITQPIYDIFLFGLPWQDELPLHMCDFSSIALIIFLLKDNAPKLLFHCAYFWGVCGATMALLTPDLEYAFPHGEYVPFFFGHSLIILAVFYVLIVKADRPHLSDIPKVIVTTAILLVGVYVINIMMGPPANFWFLVDRPDGGSLMDYFPDPPMHLVGVIPLGIFLFYVAYLPFLLKDLSARRSFK